MARRHSQPGSDFTQIKRHVTAAAAAAVQPCPSPVAFDRMTRPEIVRRGGR